MHSKQCNHFQFVFQFSLSSRCTSCLFPYNQVCGLKSPFISKTHKLWFILLQLKAYRPKKLMKLPKKEKTVQRAYGGSRCFYCVRERQVSCFLCFWPRVCHVIANIVIHNAFRACSIVIRVIGIMQVSVCSGSHSHFRIPGLPFRLFCPQEQNSWKIFQNIFLFQNIPNVWVINLMIAQHLTEWICVVI